MNILPLIFSFLLIFALTVSLLFTKRQTTLELQRGVKSQFFFLHKQESTISSREYRSIKTKGGGSHSEPKTKREKVYFRAKKCTYDQQKLALPLLQLGSPLHDRLYEPAAKLIKQLYGHTPFFVDGMEHKILQALTSRDLTDLFPDDPALDRAFYLMQRGTATYTEKSGYPSFWDYFTFSKREKPSFCHLNRMVLEGIVGPKLAAAIEERERAENEPLTSKELEELLGARPDLKMALPDPGTLFSFTHEKQANRSGILNEKTGALLRTLRVEQSASKTQ